MAEPLERQGGLDDETPLLSSALDGPERLHESRRMAKKSRASSAPFEFVFDELAGLELNTKPMFGCLAIYVGLKIVLIQRSKGDQDDGVWLATTPEHHASLKKLFPEMRSISIFGPGVTGWQLLPLDSEDFEESVVRACELVKDGDPRIGKIPKARSKKRMPKKVASKMKPAKKKST